MLESGIENQIVRYVKSLGGRALKLALINRIGFPDRTCLLPGGRVVFLEIKKPGGRVSMHQQVWLKRLRELGFVAEVVFSLEDAKEFINE